MIIKKITILLLFLFPVLIIGQSNSENYIKTTTYTVPSATVLTSPAINQANEDITYFDGLGRPVQQNASRQSFTGKDIITPIAYDPFGRQIREYLPYASTQNTKTYIDPTTLETNLIAQYKTNYGTVNDNPYSEKLLEASPLNRVFQQAAPGNDWKLGSGHEIKLNYQTNAVGEVKLFKVTHTFSNNTYTPTLVLSPLNSGYYAENQLYKTITKDENWTSGKNNTTEEFKNKQGNIVLKRTYSDYKDSNGQLISTQTAHDTYYVYDDFGNLTYVLPPKAAGIVSSANVQSNVTSTAVLLAGASLPLVATNSIVLSDGFHAQAGSTFTAAIVAGNFDDLCYQYKYDSRNRLVEKKLPGKGWEYIVYDKLDRPILTQDANLRTLNKWLFTKYDAFSRPVYTGEYVNAGNRATVQGQADATAVLFETKQGANTINNSTVYYSNNAFPNAMTLNLFTINYYDDYSFDLDGGVPQTAYGIVPITNVKGLSTGTKLRVLGTTTWITNVTYYDEKTRPIYNYSKNNFLDITSTVKSQLDLVGKVLETTSTHKKAANAEIVIKDVFEYDHAGRLLTQKQTINNLTQEVIASNTYNEWGQLVGKGVGGKINQSRLQNIDYRYNIRGWLTGINDSNANNNDITMGTGDLFGFKINYNNPSDPTKGLYNGNISQTFWKTTNSDSSLKNYTYSYDALSRLIQANDNLGRYNESLTYDKNGNIMTLDRNGNNLPNTASFGQIDKLVYTYDGGNRLQKVEDATGNTEGFTNGNSGSNIDYGYDLNGNMISDANKNVAEINYNHLNLPTAVSIGGGTINYIYDASGTKQRKTANGITTDYVAGFQYENNVLKFFPQAEGYVEYNSGNYNYIYQYKDHLGNIRLSYQDKDNNGVVNSGEIVQENNYYAFGLTHKGYNNTVNGVENKYKYNGKEFQEDLGLKMYDYGRRNYDPALGRFMNMDRFSEKYLDNTPYSYTKNNPVFFVDVNGDSLAVFKPNGSFWKIQDDGKKEWSGRFYQNSKIRYDKKTKKHYEIYSNALNFEFADPENDSKAIKDGLISQLVVLNEKQISDMVGEAGAFNPKNKDNKWSYIAAEGKGGGKFDFSVTSIPSNFPGASPIQFGKYTPYLFLPQGQNIAHNHFNFGNFLFGAAGNALGFGPITLLGGAEYNSVVNSGTNGYPGQLDSEDDQLSISSGVYYSIEHQFNNRTWSKSKGLSPIPKP